jgi:hypothetical protein
VRIEIPRSLGYCGESQGHGSRTLSPLGTTPITVIVRSASWHSVSTGVRRMQDKLQIRPRRRGRVGSWGACHFQPCSRDFNLDTVAFAGGGFTLLVRKLRKFTETFRTANREMRLRG